MAIELTKDDLSLGVGLSPESDEGRVDARRLKESLKLVLEKKI